MTNSSLFSQRKGEIPPSEGRACSKPDHQKVLSTFLLNETLKNQEPERAKGISETKDGISLPLFGHQPHLETKTERTKQKNNLFAFEKLEPPKDKKHRF